MLSTAPSALRSRSARSCLGAALVTPSRVGSAHDPTGTVGVGITRGELARRGDGPHAVAASATPSVNARARDIGENLHRSSFSRSARNGTRRSGYLPRAGHVAERFLCLRGDEATSWDVFV